MLALILTLSLYMKRIEYIDALRGFAIFLMVVGHVIPNLYLNTLLSGIFMQLCKTVKKRQLAHVFVYRIGHVDFAEQFRQWYLL